MDYGLWCIARPSQPSPRVLTSEGLRSGDESIRSCIRHSWNSRTGKVCKLPLPTQEELISLAARASSHHACSSIINNQRGSLSPGVALLDPPRPGLDKSNLELVNVGSELHDDVLQVVGLFSQLLYLSCLLVVSVSRYLQLLKK